MFLRNNHCLIFICNTMKKILLSLATLFCIILFSSCTVDELPEANDHSIQTDLVEDANPPKSSQPPTKKP